MTKYNTLFPAKYLQDRLLLSSLNIEDIEGKLSVVERWKNEIDTKSIYTKKEEQLQSDFLNDIFGKVLGYTYERGLNELNLEKEYKSKTDGTKPDGVLGYLTAENKDIRVVIELKDAYTNLDHKQNRKNDNRTPVEQAFSYVSKCGGKCKWVIVSNFVEIRLYPANDASVYQAFNIVDLVKTEKLREFYALLAKGNLFIQNGNSKVDDLLKVKIEADESITNEFYGVYKNLRSQLFKHIKENNPSIDENAILTKSQKILDRIIFICFCEDLGLLPYKVFKEILHQTQTARFNMTDTRLWTEIKGLFTAIDQGYPQENINRFNGGLFKADNIIDNLIIKDSILKEILSIERYDFDSDLNVNILGHIFEQSITDLEELKSAINGENFDKKKGKRKKDGVFYTPEYITKYIVNESVGSWLEDKKKELGYYELPKIDDEQWRRIKTGKVQKNNKTIKAHLDFWLEYRKALDNIKVLDPACGSGSFLVQVFDYLKEQRNQVNEEIATFEGTQSELFNQDTHILSNNIYGVDLNAESVEITKLALWLKTANKKDPLTALDNNIKCGNSLINDVTVAGDKAFDWNKEFPEIMQSGGFDVVVGNPPYIDSEAMTKHQPVEREYIGLTFKGATGNWDIYIPFIEQSFNLLNNSGFLAFITPDKWLGKPFGESIRTLLLDKIIKIRKYGRDVFADALVDSIVSVYSKKGSKNLTIEDYLMENSYCIEKNTIPSPYRYDTYFTLSLKIIQKIENVEQHMSDLSICESACATSDAYLLKPILYSNMQVTQDEYKVINTGTISKYVSRWGYKEMKYLGDSYLYPVCTKSDFSNIFHNTYLEKTNTPKLIIKGLTLLDVCSDEVGNIIPGKSTLIIKNKDINILKFLLSFLNSSLPIFYITEKYSSMTYNGGITFTKDMFNNLPIPSINNKTRQIFIEYSTIQIKMRENIQKIANKFLKLLKAEYQNTNITSKLNGWDELDWKQFTNELKKQKIVLSGSQKDDWFERFNRVSTEIKELQKTIAETDKQIDSLVYKLYNLTNEEIQIIESITS